MAKVNLSVVALGVTLLLLAETWAQNPRKRLAPSKAQCCDDVRSLKVQVANLTSLLEELSRKQETDLMSVVRQIMELDKQNRQQEARVTEAESKYSEINNRGGRSCSCKPCSRQLRPHQVSSNTWMTNCKNVCVAG